MPNNQGINSDITRGWLALVVLCWAFTPVQVALLLFDLYTNVISNGAWRALTTPGSEFFHPLWVPALILGVVGNLFIAIAALIALVFLFRRSKYTPAIAMAWFSLNFLLVAADCTIASRLPGFADQPFGEFDAVKELVWAGVMVVVWIPYFLFSRRVKAAFKEEWPKTPFESKPLRDSA